MSLAIALATTPEEIKSCLELRWAVFVDEQGVAPDEEQDGEDDICHHVIAQSGDKATGAARFQRIDDYIKIQRVCVDGSFRGQGIGADVIKFIVEQARTYDTVQSVRLGAQTHALDFYRKLGFREFGPEYLDAGIPHQDMELRFG